MATEYKLSYTGSEINAKLSEIDNLAKKSEVPSKTSELTNDSGFTTETYVQEYAQPQGNYALVSDIPDVPVQSVNGQTGAVSLSASDVGALPDTTTIPSKTSDLANDSGFISELPAVDQSYSSTSTNAQSGKAVAEALESTNVTISETLATKADNPKIIDKLQYEIMDDQVTITGVVDEYKQSLTTCIIPDTINGYPVTSIGNSAFSYCTSLTSITIPDSVTSIGVSAFENCYILSSIVIPDRDIIIMNNAFNDTAYDDNDANWEDGLLYIGKHLIASRNITSDNCVIKDGTITLGRFALSNCASLTSVIIPDSVKRIMSGVFYGCDNLKDVYYYGTDVRWSGIAIGNEYDENKHLLNATIHYNYNNNDVSLKYNDVSEGYPCPLNILTKDNPNILTWDGTVATTFASGIGTKEDPIIISTPSELALLATSTTLDSTGKYFKIADGIDAFNMNGMEGITPDSTAAEVESATVANIWYNIDTSGQPIFSGHFDGNGVIIYNLCVNGGGYGGLFPVVQVVKSDSCSFKNVIVTASYISAYHAAAGIVGHNSTTGTDTFLSFDNCIVKNCYMSDTATTNTACSRIGSLIIGNATHSGVTVNNCLTINNTFAVQGIGGGFVGNTSAYAPNIVVKNSISIGNLPYPSAGGITPDTRATDVSCYTNVYTNQTVDIVYTGITQLSNEQMQNENAQKNMNLDWAISWFLSQEFVGAPVPLTYSDFVTAGLTSQIGNVANVVEGKKITSLSTAEKYTFDWNALYFIKSNSGDEDITLYNNSTNAVVVDGDGNNLPSASLCILIMPESSKGMEGKMCFFVGQTGTFSIINPNVFQSKGFTVTDGEVYFTPTTTASIWKVAL